MKYAVCTAILALWATHAVADERILHTSLPAWCGGQQSSGACIRGPKDYVLINGKVVWRESNDPKNPKFFENQDKDKFGSDVSGASAASSSK